MPRTEICGLNYFLVQIGSSLLGAYNATTCLQNLIFFAHPSKMCLYEIDVINPLLFLSMMYSYNQFLLTALFYKFSKYRNMSLCNDLICAAFPPGSNPFLPSDLIEVG